MRGRLLLFTEEPHQEATQWNQEECAPWYPHDEAAKLLIFKRGESPVRTRIEVRIGLVQRGETADNKRYIYKMD